MLKSSTKKIYQYLNYLYYTKKEKFISNLKLLKIGIKEETFFGYYDKSPINSTNSFIIFQSTEYPTNKLPSKNSSIKLILYDLKKNNYKKKEEIFAYNWQQGAKLQWLDGNRFIFNNYLFKEKKYISKIYNSVSGEFEQVIDYPIYDCYKDYALTLNFERLNLLRPDYGYRNITSDEKELLQNDNDGIFYIDLLKNISKLLISINDIINLHYKKSMKNAKHWFNHIMISPDGNKFMFLHRWLVGNRKYDALIISNKDGTGIKCLADDDMVSHCCWYGNDKIISFLRDKNLGNKYYLIDIVSGSKEILGPGIIDGFGDGHPSVFGNKMLFDTYPNKARMKELFVYDLNTGELEKLGEFFESFDFYGETRCDLHPKWSLDGKKIFFDSVHEGTTYLYMMDIKDNNG